MEKQQILSSAQKALKPFETENIIHFAQNMSAKKAMENPLLIVILLILLFYAVVKRSKPVLIAIFSIVAIILLIRFTLPSEPGAEMSLRSTIPFAFGGVGIGAAIIYFVFIKGE